MQIDHDVILQAKEKLGDENARIIIEELGVTDYDERDMKCCCPFHQEDHASFIYNKKAFNFRCFGACSRSYDILDVFMYKGMTYIEACTVKSLHSQERLRSRRQRSSYKLLRMPPVTCLGK